MSTTTAITLEPGRLYDIVDGQFEAKELPGARHGGIEGEPTTLWPFPPDMAVAIISFTDVYERVYARVLEYLAAGVQQVWLVSPEHQEVGQND